jgi:diguanylate cyclase (GGDEF)-like protein
MIIVPKRGVAMGGQVKTSRSQRKALYRTKTPITIDADGVELEFIKFLNSLLPQKPDLDKISRIAIERATNLLEFDIMAVGVEYDDGVQIVCYPKTGLGEELVETARARVRRDMESVFPSWKDKSVDEILKKLSEDTGTPALPGAAALPSMLLHKIDGVPGGFVQVFSHKENAYSEKQEFVLGVLAYWLVSYFGLSKIYEKLEALAVTDPLTGVFNRRKFEQELEREVERSRRYKVDFCLVMVDLDNLKGINDTFGHYAGDLALQKCARLLQSNVRKVDVVTRIGGDEFVLILPHTKSSGARIVAERVLEILKKAPIKVDGQDIRASLTMCITGFQPDDTYQSMYKRVDAGLNEAKKTCKGGYSVIETLDGTPK